ncbi:MAG: sugar transferase [Candidatus Omnitrophota bacterium]
MLKRIFFHSIHFILLAALAFFATYVYFATAYGKEFIFYSWVTAYRFTVDKMYNFLMVLSLTYFLAYVSGVIKYTIEEKFFRFAAYLKETFKLLIILGMVSSLEFFIFYKARIGRLIYVYMFLLYSLYYYLYRKIRYRGNARSLLWMAHTSPDEIIDGYLKKSGNFIVYDESSLPADAGHDIDVVYQDGFIDEHTSESLIKNKLGGYNVVELAELVEKEAGKIPVDYVNIHWFLEKFDVIDNNYFRSSRMFNIFMSLILLMILFPPGFIIALIHRSFSKGPIFFVQERVGQHGKIFHLIKFRTMVINAEENGAQFASKNDFRITPMGKWMRRFRLDEIPQLINVLKGNMSMVGPRPERAVFIDGLSKDIPYYKLRLLVAPGLTGWAQINGVYAGSNIDDHKEKLEYDLYYVKNRSIFMDLMILLRTINTIVKGNGA